jgi:replicative DNA helicase
MPEDVGLDVAIDALKDEYTQQLILSTIKTDLLPDITTLGSEELVERLTLATTKVIEAVDSSEKVFSSGQLAIFEDEEEVDALIVPTGISRRWDEHFGAVRRQELMLIGGKRGSGKSVVSMNFAKQQWMQDKVCPYFTIEMTSGETNQRFLTSVAGINAMDFRNKSSSTFEVLKLAVHRAHMFEGGQELLENYITELGAESYKLSDLADFERELMKLTEKDPKIIIIDDRELTIAAIDAHLTQLKAVHGDKLTMAVVDYLNQVILENKDDMYDWKDQLQVAKSLKNLARKHDIVIVSPYQVDDSGEARLSKAILDPVDYALVIDRIDDLGVLQLRASKLRSLGQVDFTLPMEWSTLTTGNEDIGGDGTALHKAEVNEAFK